MGAEPDPRAHGRAFAAYQAALLSRMGLTEEDLASDIEEHLKNINQKMNEINDHKLKIINGIFSKIEEVYTEYRDRIDDMRILVEELLHGDDVIVVIATALTHRAVETIHEGRPF